MKDVICAINTQLSENFYVIASGRYRVISDRRVFRWIPKIGLQPFGDWELAIPTPPCFLCHTRPDRRRGTHRPECRWPFTICVGNHRTRGEAKNRLICRTCVRPKFCRFRFWEGCRHRWFHPDLRILPAGPEQRGGRQWLDPRLVGCEFDTSVRRDRKSDTSPACQTVRVFPGR